MSADNKSIEIGLKTEVKRQVGLKNWEQNIGNYNQTHLVNTWKKILAAGMEEDVVEMIWNYCLNSPETIWIKVNSEKFGLKSTIGQYENKKGIKSLAHYTANGCYLGSVLKLGDKPIVYDGNFRLTKKRFSLDITKLPNLTYFNGAYLLQHLFIPIVSSIIIEDDED